MIEEVKILDEIQLSEDDIPAAVMHELVKT